MPAFTLAGSGVLAGSVRDRKQVRLAREQRLGRSRRQVRVPVKLALRVMTKWLRKTPLASFALRMTKTNQVT